MTTFTKEQLIEQAQDNLLGLKNYVTVYPERAESEAMNIRLIEIALAALTDEPVVVIVPPIWKHYSNSKVAETYERAMDDAGVQWRDEEPEETELRETVEDAQRNEESF